MTARVEFQELRGDMVNLLENKDVKNQNVVECVDSILSESEHHLKRLSFLEKDGRLYY